jgi:hypothetical protein
MELVIKDAGLSWHVHVAMTLQEVGSEETFTLTGDVDISKGECSTREQAVLTAQGAMSHMTHRMINRWRLPLVHSLREMVVDGIMAQMGHGEAPRSASEEVAATPIAEGVVPTPIYRVEGGHLHCQHGVILYGTHCTSCGPVVAGRDFVCTCGAWWDPPNVIEPEHHPGCALTKHKDFHGKIRIIV